MEKNKKEPINESAQLEKENPAKTQKIMIIVAAAVLAVAFIVGGVVMAKSYHDVKASYTYEDGTPKPDSPQGMAEGHGESAQVITDKDATKDAEVNDSDAIERIKEFSDEELGIKLADFTSTKEDSTHKLVVSQQAFIIKGEKYVQVDAAEIKKNKDEKFSITMIMKYYISFDGKTVLKEDPADPGNYQELT
ncbi:MAG: hypothetical protein IKE65_07605 [Clostridia bacterium]|nr:hypothetical protein [Clostridia bacterium]